MHTPGPWTVCDDGEPGEPMLKVVGRTARHEIALCCTGAVPQYEENANAHLIAAAPEFYELAAAVADHFEGTDARLGHWANDLIAKVKP